MPIFLKRVEKRDKMMLSKISILFLAMPFVQAGKMSDMMTAMKGNDVHAECAPRDALTKCQIAHNKLEIKLGESWSDIAELNIQLRHIQKELHLIHQQWQHAEENLANLQLENQRLQQYTNRIWLPPAPGLAPTGPLPEVPRKKKSARFTNFEMQNMI